MAQNKVWVVKANGQKQPFSDTKLRASLRRSGASKSVIDEIVSQIHTEIRDGDTTRKIYQRAYALLRTHKSTVGVAIDYNLRNAVMEMGPSGFAFEKFVGEIFKLKGFEVEVGVMEKGWCVEHEIDVSARKDGAHHLVECKFHNQFGVKSDLKVALYVRERFQDIEKNHEHTRAEGSRYHEPWLITNTKLTSKAIQYGECAGLNVVGWNYPKQGNLHDWIVETGVHPITALTSIGTSYKKQLLKKGVVLCRDIKRKPSVLKSVGMSKVKIREVVRQVEHLCKAHAARNN
jgi:hypothetical protein